MLFSKSSAKVQKIIEKNKENYTKYCNNLQQLARTGKAENKFRTFAVANKKLQRRVKAAAQHSSSELGSAFTLHFPCNVKRNQRQCAGWRGIETK